MARNQPHTKAREGKHHSCRILSLNPPIRRKVGLGYGGVARWQARQGGCKATYLNYLQVQDEQNRSENRELGREGFLMNCVKHARYRTLSLPRWQEFLIARGTLVILPDHITLPHAHPATTKPMKQRLSLGSDLVARHFHQEAFLKSGFDNVDYVEGTEHLVTHCSEILTALEDDGDHTIGVSTEDAENAKTSKSQ